LVHDAAVDLAEVLLERRAPGDAERARTLAQQAVTAASRIGAARTLARARALLAPAPPAAGAVASARAREALLRREGEYWAVGFDGRELRLRDLVGVRYLARLLEEPGRERLALDLAQSAARAPLRGGAGDTGALVDARARLAYEGRLARLRDELDDAEKLADPTRAERARAELDALATQLAAALGLGGRDRRAGGDSERARLAVTQRIKSVIAKLERLHPALARHLVLHVRTGHYCVYLPDPDHPVRWEVLS
jgi:non-specific serine/threonine protein kinase